MGDFQSFFRTRKLQIRLVAKTFVWDILIYLYLIGVKSLDWSAFGKYVVSGSERTLLFWDIITMECIHTIDNMFSAASVKGEEIFYHISLVWVVSKTNISLNVLP